MPYETLTNYTEVDPNSKLTVTSTRVTAEDLDRDEDAYLYFDFGAGYFNDIDFDFTINGADTSVAGGRGTAGLTASTVNDVSAWGANDIEVILVQDAVNYLIRLRIDATTDTYSPGVASGTWYVTLQRASGSDDVYLYIYSDETRETLVDTLTVSGAGVATTYRYFYAMASFNDATAGANFDGYFENFNLGVVAVSVPALAMTLTGVGSSSQLDLTSVAGAFTFTGNAPSPSISVSPPALALTFTGCLNTFIIPIHLTLAPRDLNLLLAQEILSLTLKPRDMNLTVM